MTTTDAVRTAPPSPDDTVDVRVAVDLNRCQGYAQCCFLAPDTFRLQGSEGLFYTPETDRSQRERILRSAAACPVQAIAVEILGDDQ
jgi:ferredoxin